MIEKTCLFPMKFNISINKTIFFVDTFFLGGTGLLQDEWDQGTDNINPTSSWVTLSCLVL